MTLWPAASNRGGHTARQPPKQVDTFAESLSKRYRASPLPSTKKVLGKEAFTLTIETAVGAAAAVGAAVGGMNLIETELEVAKLGFSVVIG